MKNSNLPAFPRPWSKIKQSPDAPEQISVAQNGLSKREYFALEIMKSNIVAETDTSIEFCADYIGIKKDEYKGRIHWHKFLSKLSIEMADSLLDELSKSDE